MALEPHGNGEVCSVTGTEANARFKDNLGFAWYESRYDLSYFVDVSGQFDGPVCDDIIAKALEKGDVFVYGYASGGALDPNEIPADAAAVVFGRAAQRQAKLIAEPPARTPVRMGMTAFEDASSIGAPRWLAPLASFTGRNSLKDFEFAGGLWAMGVLASGGEVSYEAALDAGRDLHAFVLAAMAEDRDMMSVLGAVAAEHGIDITGDGEPSGTTCVRRF